MAVNIAEDSVPEARRIPDHGRAIRFDRGATRGVQLKSPTCILKARHIQADGRDKTVCRFRTVDTGRNVFLIDIGSRMAGQSLQQFHSLSLRRNRCQSRRGGVPVMQPAGEVKDALVSGLQKIDVERLGLIFGNTGARQLGLEGLAQCEELLTQPSIFGRSTPFS